MPTTIDNAPFTRVVAKTAQEVCKAYKPDEKAESLVTAALTPRQFFDLLVAKELWVEAARFLAQALPKREAVWWACQCVRQVGGPELPPKAAAPLAAAEKWVLEPSEDNCRRAQTAAETAQGMETPAGAVAQAAFWSGTSLAPAGKPAVPPAEHMTASAVVGSLILAALQTEPEKFIDKLSQFLNLGIATAAGTNRWKAASPSPGPAGGASR